VTIQEAAALYRAEKAKRQGKQRADLTTHNWQAIGHRLIDVDTHRLRPDAFLKGHTSG
jgi:hypothetical protein